MAYIKHGYPKLVVDLGKLRHNIDYVKDLCAREGVEIAGVIKGCTGLVPCAREYEKAGVKYIASSRLEQLAALKAQGKQLGNPNAADAMRAINAQGVARRKRLASEAPENRHAYNAVRLMPGTLQSKADFLNAEGYRTRNGKAWTPTAVKRLFDRYAAV